MIVHRYPTIHFLFVHVTSHAIRQLEKAEAKYEAQISNAKMQ